MPDRACAPVPTAAVQDLLAAAGGAGVPLALRELVLVDVAAAHARRFKVDAQFALGMDTPSARFSINDKGEPDALRARVRAALPQARPALDRVFGLAAPGEVQFTIAVKAGPRGLACVTLYLEELGRSPRGEAIRRGARALASVGPPAEDGLEPAAVGVDLDPAGNFVGIKDYRVRTLTRDPEDATLRAFPVHPVTGTRRFLHACRYAPGGVVLGSKLLWMSETWRPEDAPRAWGEVDRIAAGRPVGPTDRALAALRAGWRHAPEAFLYPDLVGLNAGADGRQEGAIVYVSVR